MLAIFKQILVAGVIALVMLVQAAQAQKTPSRVPGPQFKLPESTEKCVHDPDSARTGAKTGKCVRDSDFMRINHPALLNHKRDRTVRQGIRTKTDSLQNCVDCHVTKDEKGEFIKANDPEQGFCAACHEYVAVKITCFDCHRTTPDVTRKTARIPKIPAHAGLLANNASGSDEAKSLGSFLKGVAR